MMRGPTGTLEGASLLDLEACSRNKLFSRRSRSLSVSAKAFTRRAGWLVAPNPLPCRAFMAKFWSFYVYIYLLDFHYGIT